jgi:hypothetical protein
MKQVIPRVTPGQESNTPDNTECNKSPMIPVPKVQRPEQQEGDPNPEQHRRRQRRPPGEEALSTVRARRSVERRRVAEPPARVAVERWGRHVRGRPVRIDCDRGRHARCGCCTPCGATETAGEVRTGHGRQNGGSRLKNSFVLCQG